MPRLGLARTQCLAAVLLAAAPGTLYAAASSSPPGPISLTAAVRQAYDRSPQIGKARADVAFYEGSLRATRGAFCTVLGLTPSVEHREGHLSPQSLTNEERRRTGYSELTKAFHQLRTEIESIMAGGSTELPVCPGGIVIYSSTLQKDGIPVPLCRQVSQPFDASTPRSELDALEAYGASMFTPTRGTGDYLQIQTRIAQILGMSVQDYSETLRQQGLDRVAQSYRLASEWETRSALSLERLGVFPEFEWVRTAALDLTLTKPRRDGTMFQLQARISGVEDNFRGKALDPIFGGKGVQNAFRSRVALVAALPLMQGRGRVSAGAPERAAEKNFDAARWRFEHTVSSEVLRIAEAYFDVIAAQTELSLLEESVSYQRKLRDGMSVLLKAGDIARADLTRASARLADMESQVSSARIGLLASQSALAQVTGAPSGLMAEQTFSASPPDLDVHALARGARTARADLKSAGALREAAHILREAARVETRPRLDLTLSAGFGSDYFGPYFRVLRDELARDPKEPTDSAVDYWSPVGGLRTFSDHPQPEASVKLTFELPFGRNRAKGQLAQAEASLRRNDILAADLTRVIDHNAEQQAAAVMGRLAELKQRMAAATQHTETWKATQARRAANDMNLIDTLVTEQDYTAARQALVQAQHDYAIAVAELRFETGTLVPFKDGVPGDADLSGLLTGGQ